jgi:AraC family carnitine catabolism transcriptional activator
VHAVLNLIGQEFGQRMVHRIAEHLLLGDIRSPTAFQRYRISDRYGVDDPRLIRMLEIFEAETEQRLLVGSIALHLRISKRQLERLCRAHFGASPMRVLEDIRMRKARWLVEKTSLPIIEISLICGSSTASQFAKSFKRRFGIRPSELRRARNSLPSVRSGEESIDGVLKTDAA